MKYVFSNRPIVRTSRITLSISPSLASSYSARLSFSISPLALRSAQFERNRKWFVIFRTLRIAWLLMPPMALRWGWQTALVVQVVPVILLLVALEAVRRVEPPVSN